MRNHGQLVLLRDIDILRKELGRKVNDITIKVIECHANELRISSAIMESS